MTLDIDYLEELEKRAVGPGWEVPDRKRFQDTLLLNSRELLRGYRAYLESQKGLVK